VVHKYYSKTFTLTCLGLALAILSTSACEVPNPTRDQVSFPGAGLSSATKVSGSYGPDARYHMYDLYRPRVSRFKTGAPLVIFVHGGAWSGGDRDKDLLAFGGPITSLLDKGWAVASVDYRLTLSDGGSRGSRHPAQVHDISRAVRWFKVNGSRFGLDTSTIILAGHSAGGHLAGLVGTSCTRSGARVACDPLFEAPGLPSPLKRVDHRVDGIITLAPVIDVESFGRANTNGSRKAVNDLLGCSSRTGVCNPSLARQLNPLLRLDRSDPPWYMAHGKKDTMVPYANHSKIAYERALGTLGDSRVWVDAVENANHDIPGVNAAFVEIFAERVRTRELR